VLAKHAILGAECPPVHSQVPIEKFILMLRRFGTVHKAYTMVQSRRGGPQCPTDPYYSKWVAMEYH